MSTEPAHLTVNRSNWDDRAPVHAASPYYEWDRFVADPAHLSRVVEFDRPRLPDLDGVEGVHLQCHLGTDTVSLARLGARMTGLDLSPASVEQARRLARECGTPVEYVVADVEDAAAALGGRRFDLVYVSMGALCWLPSVRRWAAAVAACLRPGGRVFVRDVHPLCGALRRVPGTDGRPDALQVAYPYFETPEPQVWDEAETYVATADGAPPPITHTVTHAWNHGLGETVQALLDQGVRLDRLEEHDSVPFCPFPGLMEPVDPADPQGHGEWRLTDAPERVALSFTLLGTRV